MSTRDVPGLLLKWLPGAEATFTNAIARHAVEVLSDGTPLTDAERKEVSRLLDYCVMTGQLERVYSGDSKRSSTYRKKSASINTLERPGTTTGRALTARNIIELPSIQDRSFAMLKTLRDIKDSPEVKPYRRGRVGVDTGDMWQRFIRALKLVAREAEATTGSFDTLRWASLDAENFKALMARIPQEYDEYGLVDQCNAQRVIWRPAVLNGLSDGELRGLASRIRRETQREYKREPRRYTDERL